jgi:hypothetical protein
MITVLTAWIPMLERDRGARARILWVEACMLTPNQDSGSLRTIRLLRILVQMGCKVTFIADNLDGAEPYRTQLASEGIEVIHAPHCPSVEEYLKKHGDEYDVITLCRHYIAIQHVATVRAVNPEGTDLVRHRRSTLSPLPKAVRLGQ